jgi:hypothetical protein
MSRRALGAFVAVASVIAAFAISTMVSTPTSAAMSSNGRGGVAMGGPWLSKSAAGMAVDLDRVAATGARYVRVTMSWASLEPTRGAYAWSNMDTVVDLVRNRGLELIAVVAYTPTWARLSACSTSMFCAPANPGDYASFVLAAATRYTPRGVGVWELWNEPNISMFWKPAPDPTGYAQLLIRGSAAVKSVNPGATVLSAGLSPAPDAADGSTVHPRTFLTKLYAAGAGNAFDAVAMHPYSYPYAPMYQATWNAFAGVLPMLRDVMVAQGDSGKQIWATEFGVPTGGGTKAVDEATQALHLQEAFAAQTTWSWLGPIIWYNAMDTSASPSGYDQAFGLRHYDGTPKPALAAFTTVMGATAPVSSSTSSSTTSSSTTSSSTTSSSTTSSSTTSTSTTSTTRPVRGRKSKIRALVACTYDKRACRIR